MIMTKFTVTGDELYPWYTAKASGDEDADQYTIELSDDELADLRKVEKAFHAWQFRLGKLIGDEGHAESNHYSETLKEYAMK